MTDSTEADIVERLREPLWVHSFAPNSYRSPQLDIASSEESMKEAASEIEELRAALDAFGKVSPQQYEKELAKLRAERDAAKAGLASLVNAKALKGVRGIVAGWNGEGRDEPFRERHPKGLGATLPKTNCGAVYELDEAMQAAASLLATDRGGS